MLVPSCLRPPSEPSVSSALQSSVLVSPRSSVAPACTVGCLSQAPSHEVQTLSVPLLSLNAAAHSTSMRRGGGGGEGRRGGEGRGGKGRGGKGRGGEERGGEGRGGEGRGEESRGTEE